jgi:sugar phosphate isomerase/epimerase
MEQRLRIAAITDEFSPDLDTATQSMAAIGMTGAEIRMVNGKNIIALTDEEVDGVRRLCASRGLEIMSIASPLLKCVLPGAPQVDERFQQDMFAAQYGFDDQPRLAERAFAIAGRLGARIIRVFSYWRSVEPEKCFPAIVDALGALAEKAAGRGLIIGLENEHACNISTASESLRVLNAVTHPNLELVWDPANCLISGEDPFPGGYQLLPKGRIGHVHVKDCYAVGHKPCWGPVGTLGVDWRGQIHALVDDGYRGWLSLETHWPGPNGDKHLASVICGWNLKSLATF